MANGKIETRTNRTSSEIAAYTPNELLVKGTINLLNLNEIALIELRKSIYHTLISLLNQIGNDKVRLEQEREKYLQKDAQGKRKRFAALCLQLIETKLTQCK